MRKKARVHIGTSGFHYKEWSGRFYPEDLKPNQWLKYYTGLFKTVELNSPFYHLLPKKTFENWKKQVPKGFLFSVKGSRYITHVKRLKEPRDPLKRFFKEAEGLENTFGPVLFQLPPSFKFDPDRLDKFLSALPDNHRYTVEFRNQTWFRQETYDILAKHNVAFCICEIAGWISPIVVTAKDLVYIRLHGPGKYAYTGNYTEKTLKEWKKRIAAWVKEGKTVHCYFDNTQEDFATNNALRMQELCRNLN
jgi:uncharacterized protein YecE (DUF72 family)